MRHTQKRQVTVLGVLLILIVLGVGAATGGAWAQSENETTRGQGIEVSPPLIELEADPGDTVKTEIKLRNITDLELLARGSVNDFVAGNERGEPRILFEEDEESPYSLKNYIAEVPDLTLEPHERKATEVTINVPEDASPGGHFGVVRFSSIPANTGGDSSQVSLSASIGTLILLSVSGDVEEKLSIKEQVMAKLNDPDNGKTSEGGDKEDNISTRGSFFETGPLALVTRLDNQGNVYLQPSGEVTVTNMFDQEVAHTSFNESKKNILPESIRRFQHDFKDKDFWFGRYTASTNIQYGAEAAALENDIVFWVIPYKLIAIVILMLVAVGYFGRKALQAYKRNIVKKYNQQNAEQNNQPLDQD